MTREEFEAGKQFKIDPSGIAKLKYHANDMYLTKNGRYMAELAKIHKTGFVLSYWPFSPKRIKFSDCTLIKSKP